MLVLTAMGCGMQNLCRRRQVSCDWWTRGHVTSWPPLIGQHGDDEDDNSSFGYSVAISNNLFREEAVASRSLPPCMNCVLIEMGEMVCYTGILKIIFGAAEKYLTFVLVEKCPDCGRVPPGRRKKPKERIKLFRKLSARKPAHGHKQQFHPHQRHQVSRKYFLIASNIFGISATPDQ